MFTTFPKETTIIYLDQNKWIDLSRAYHSMPGGQKFQHVLEKIQKAVSNKSAIFPLSFQHYYETNKNSNLDQRKRLARVMAEISQGIAISPQERMLQWELIEALGKLYNAPILKIPPVFGYGFSCAFGISIIGTDKDGDNVAIPQNQIDEVKDRITSPDATLYLLIENGDDEFNNWIQKFQVSHTKLSTNLERFRQEVRKGDKSLHKSAYAEQLVAALEDEISKALSHFNKTTEEFYSISADGLLRFCETVPTLDLEIELNVGRNEHWDRDIEPNDITDISFLSVAIPYCDVLIVEKYFHNLIKQKGLDEKYKTQVCKNLNDLEGILA